MQSIKQLFSGGPKDERISAQLGSIYKIGFYIMVWGILFDLYTRFNYLAQRDVDGNTLVQSPLEYLVLIVACVVVATLMTRRGIYSDSLRFTEARSFAQTGMIVPSIGLAVLIAVAAVGGRLYNEMLIFGWSGVTWAGDIAMFIILLGMFAALVLAIQYLSWRSYRRREDRLEREEE